MSMSTEEKIRHYQRSIDRSILDKPRLLHCIEVLSKLPVTVQHLQVTGVGRTVNALRKIDDGVGDAAKRLVGKWKVMVANTDTSDDEDEACVPDVPESYESPDCDSDSERLNMQQKRYSSNNPSEALRRSTISPSRTENVNTNSLPHTSSSDRVTACDSDEKSVASKSSISKDKHKSKSTGHSSKHSSRKDKNLPKDSDSKSSNKDKHESSRSSKDLDISDNKKRDKNRDKSEKSLSSSKKSLLDKKRKYDSSSSDGENDKKKRKQLSSEDEEEESEYNEETNFVINDVDSSEKEEMDMEVEENEDEEEDEQEDGSYTREWRHSSDSQSRSKESSLKGASHSDKAKSKERHHGSASKTKSHESSDNSSKDERYSSSKSDHRVKEEKHKSDEHRSKESKSKTSHSSSSSKNSSKDKDKHRDKSKESEKDKSGRDKGKESSNNIRKDEKEKSSSSKSIRDDKGKCKENKEYRESKEHSKHKDSKDKQDHKEHKDDKDSKEKKKVKKSSGNDGIDCNSGTSFADALGMCMAFPPMKKKKENMYMPSTSVKSTKMDQPSTSSSTYTPSYKSTPVKTRIEPPESPETLPLLSPNMKLEPLNRIEAEVDLAATLPEPSPNYKPLPHMNSAQRRQNEDQMLSQVIHSKNQRTKVFSGNKSVFTNVPTLYDLCIRVLIENIDALEFTGGVPYFIIKPVLERATADQLFMLEHYNPYLIEDSDSLWQFHCNKDFRTKTREEMETWREMYMRCLDEREAKLRALTANIKQSRENLMPVRSTKLAYVDNIVKPPRNVLRKQVKYGTANASTKSSDAKKKLIAAASGSGLATSAERISVPPPPPSRIRQPSTTTIKKIKAPLMAKALQAIKGRYKR